MSKRVIVVSVLAAIVAVAGCSPSPTNKKQSVQNSTQVQRLPDDYSVEIVKASKRYKIGVLFPIADTAFWVNEAYGVIDQAKKDNVEIVWLSADGYGNTDRQISQLEDLSAQHVDGILLGATSFGGTAPAVERVVGRGIPVVNQVTSTNSNKVSSRVMTDYAGIGRKQAEQMAKLLNGSGKIVMLSGPSGAEWASNEVKGFKETLAKIAPNIKIVAERFCNDSFRATSQKQMEDLLVAFPDINGLFSVSDILAAGAIDSIVRSGKIDRISITTAGFDPDSIDYMRKNYIAINVDENPVVTGRVALNTLVRVLDKQAVAQTIFVPNPIRTSKDLQNGAEHWAPSTWRLR